MKPHCADPHTTLKSRHASHVSRYDKVTTDCSVQPMTQKPIMLPSEKKGRAGHPDTGYTQPYSDG